MPHRSSAHAKTGTSGFVVIFARTMSYLMYTVPKLIFDRENLMMGDDYELNTQFDLHSRDILNCQCICFLKKIVALFVAKHDRARA